MIVQKLLEYGCDVNLKNKKGMSPLFNVCTHICNIDDIDNDILEMLILAGVDINENEDNINALMLCVHVANYYGAFVLMSYGIDLECKNKEGKTAYDLMVDYGDDKMIKILNTFKNSK